MKIAITTSSAIVTSSDGSSFKSSKVVAIPDVLLNAFWESAEEAVILNPFSGKFLAEECDGLIITDFLNQKDFTPSKLLKYYQLIHTYVSAGKLIMGIGSGMHAINACYGGETRQLSIEEARKHVMSLHSVKCCEGETNPYLTYCNTKLLYSNHLMAISKVGDGLEAVALSEGNMIEAIESKDKKVFGVQWNPEYSDNSNLRVLIQYLKSLCNQNKEV